MRVGFIGLGVMGRPIALNLVAAGVDLVCWNRSAPAALTLAEAGAEVATSPSEVFAAAEVVIIMLAHQEAVDTTLARGTPAFEEMVRNRVVVHMGTTSPQFSAGLGADVTAAGGTYVECPVSGSRVPAEAGELVGMLAGPPEAVARVRPLLAPVCRRVFECGPVPDALQTKLAVNLVLVTLVAGLAEAYHFAEVNGLDLDVVRGALDAGQMASPISTVKLALLAAREFPVQAAITDVHTNCRLVTESARLGSVPTPLLDAATALYAEAETAGHGDLDMAAVILALEARSAQSSAFSGSPATVGSTARAAASVGSGGGVPPQAGHRAR